MSLSDEFSLNPGSFNPEMLVLARNAAGLNQAKVASLVDVGQNTVSRWETGARYPSVDEVDFLSKTFGRPTDFFYQAIALTEINGDVLFHRKKASTGKLVLRRLHARLAVARVALSQLLKSIELWDVAIPRIPIASVDHASAAAKRVRVALKIQPGPIRDLFEVVEAAGAVVFKFDFGCRDIDAIGVWPSDMPPIIFVNGLSSPDRIRFSVAHELAHLVLHSSQSETMEAEADEFAGEFLLPTASAQTELQGLTTSTIWRSKHRWRISGQAILRAALRAKTIDDRRYKSMMCYFSKRGWRRQEPHSIDSETPHTVRKIVEAYQQQLGYSASQIRDLTGLTTMELNLLFGIQEPPPKIKLEL